MAGGLSPTQAGSHDFVENGLIPEDATLPFNLSPGDFRDRTSSNASSIGRLSPIQSALEPDLENQVPSMSPLPWQSGLDSSYTSQEGFNADTLSESLRDMFVGENDLSGINGDGYAGDSLGLQSNLSTPSPVPQQLSPGSNGYQGVNGRMGTPPPPYPDHLRRSPQQTSPPSQMGTTSISTLPSNSLNYSGGSVTQGLPSQDVGGNFMSQSMDVLQNDMYEGILDMLDTTNPNPPPNTTPQTRPQLNQFAQSQVMPQQVIQQQPMPQQAQAANSAMTLQQRRQQLLMMLRSQPSESLLRQALTQRTQLALQRQQVVKAAQMTPPQQRTVQQQQLLNAYEQQQQQVHAQLQQQQQQQQVQPQIGNGVNGLNVFMNQGVNSEAMELQQSMPQFSNPNLAPLNLPTDLDVNYSEMEATDVNCDVEQVLNLERSFDDNLDFNFDQNQANQSSSDNPYVLQLSH